MTRRMAGLIAAVGLALAGCDLCESGDVRCDGSVAQECSGGDWDGEHDCGAEGLSCGVDSQCGFLGAIGNSAGAKVVCCY